MAYTTLWSLPVMSLIYGGCLTMALLIPVTYLTCVAEGNCPKFLPTISDTWVYPPGNYISRWFVGNLVDLFAMVQVAIYWDNVTVAKQNPARVRGTCLSYEALLGLSWVALFGLSWVGAICDNSSAESCRGNNDIHTTCALVFFIGYDFYMLANNYKNPDKVTYTHWASALLSAALTGARVALPVLGGMPRSSTPLAVVEWTNVALIVHWTINYPLHKTLTGSLTWGAISGDKESINQDTSVLASFNCRTMLQLVNGLFVFVLGACLVAGMWKGTLPTDRVPYISDMWVYPPGNWFSRWGVVQASHWLYWIVMFVGFSSANNCTSCKLSVSDKAMLILGEVAAFGLSIVGCVNEDENITIHTVAATVFFVGFDVYMVITALNAARGRTGSKKDDASYMPLVILAVALLAQFLRVVLSGGDVGDSIKALLEWTNAFALIAFLNVDVMRREETDGCFAALMDTSEEDGASVSYVTLSMY